MVESSSSSNTVLYCLLPLWNLNYELFFPFWFGSLFSSGFRIFCSPSYRGWHTVLIPYAVREHGWYHHVYSNTHVICVTANCRANYQDDLLDRGLFVCFSKQNTGSVKIILCMNYELHCEVWQNAFCICLSLRWYTVLFQIGWAKRGKIASSWCPHQV